MYVHLRHNRQKSTVLCIKSIVYRCRIVQNHNALPKVLCLKIPYCPSCFSFPSSTFKLFLKQSGWKNHSFPFLLPPAIAFVVAVPNVARGCKNVKFRDWLGRACKIWLHTDSCRPSLKVCTHLSQDVRPLPLPTCQRTHSQHIALFMWAAIGRSL